MGEGHVTHMNDAVGSQNIGSCDGCTPNLSTDKLECVGAGGNGGDGLTVLECR